jgi:hypothetical protein
MIAPVLAALVVAAPGAPAPPAATCLPSTPPPGLGAVDPFRAPDPKATELNTAGKTYYRDGKWEEARIEYRAAEAADPTFLAPRLNIACSFVRQERFAEATAEVEALLARAYVPWAREVLEAFDLGALKPRPEMARIRRAMTASAAAWGADLDDAVLLVGRARAPLKIPATGPGFFILNPHQEVYAFLPTTGRFRQLTNEDGRVLALLRSPDRRRIVYVTAEKLIRGAKDDDLALRGVALGELTLATMTAEPPIRIAGDVRRLELAAVGAMTTFRIEGDKISGSFRRGEKGTLDPLPASNSGGGRVGAPTHPLPNPPAMVRGEQSSPASHAKPAGRGGVVVTARGTEPAAAAPVAVGRAGCRASAREVVAAGKPRTVVVSAPGRPPRRIGEQFGAGLAGLPIP